MRFGRTLRSSVYRPWQDKYIDYGKLKNLLREEKFEEDREEWTEDDEKRFCDEIFNVQLEKVAQFQQDQFDSLRQRVDSAFQKLKDTLPTQAEGEEVQVAATASEADAAKLRELEKELDDFTSEVKELKKFSSINYTGFLKIVKKHDRKRGDRYRVRPMMQMSLAQRPFNSEQGYSPLLNKLSIMYFAIRERLDDDAQAPLDLEVPAETRNGERYTAHKFWVHPENLLEVKTLILRRLPCLVYSEKSAKELDGNDAPAITSLYFDGPKFELYSNKVNRESESSTLRLRWYGQLSDRPEIFVEEKFSDGSGSSHESRFNIKDKYVKPLIDGEYSTEKAVQKMERLGQPADQISDFKNTVTKIENAVTQKSLSPVLRANYKRTAFQKPADDRVRISIDHDLAFIREDTVDSQRPCRDPKDWHRAEIDSDNMTYPFKSINQSEVSRFPFAVLEVKLKEDGSRKRPGWIQDLMASHLVHPCPRFSKFVHGIACLFEDYVNNLPFWLSDLETDIRKDPLAAFDEEEQRRARRADDEMAVGSFVGGRSSSYKPAQSSPIGKSYLSERMSADSRAYLSQSLSSRKTRNQSQGEIGEESAHGQQQQQQQQQQTESLLQPGGYGTLSSAFPGFSFSKYANSRRARKVQLPKGVVKPKEWIKNAGEVKVEPKVWLANERTFLKWQHIGILLGSLAVGLYTAGGKDTVAQAMGIFYIVVAAFAGLWGYYMLRVRRNMIVERSGKDFDNVIGPLVISLALVVALIINFGFQVSDHVACGKSLVMRPDANHGTLYSIKQRWPDLGIATREQSLIPRRYLSEVSRVEWGSN